MFGLNGIVFSEKYEKYLSFLHSFKQVTFGNIIEHVGDDSLILIWLIVGFILILFFKNSNQKLENFKFNYITILLSIVLFIGSILSLNKVSEFLYFNF